MFGVPLAKYGAIVDERLSDLLFGWKEVARASDLTPRPEFRLIFNHKNNHKNQ